MIFKVAALFAVASALTPTRSHVVDLDFPPRERWNAILADKEYDHFVEDMLGYFHGLTHQWLGIVTWVAKHMTGIFPISEYIEEMEGISETLQARHPEVANPMGLLVAGNLLYQLEGLSIECKLFNTTGPCPSSTTYGHPSVCSSIIAIDKDMKTHLGRNLDWNFPKVLTKYMIKVDYQRQKKTIFSSTGFLGFVGALHGMNDRYAISFNARDNGGSVMRNLYYLIKHFITPSQLLRKTLENESFEFSDAVQALSTTKIANPCYFIIADGKKPNGAIIVRNREDAADVWYLNDKVRKGTIQPTWFHVQTNYDPDEVEPSYDARREPAVEHLLNLGPEKLNSDFLLDIMKQWPTLNPHTDTVAIMTPATGKYEDFTTIDTKADENNNNLIRGDSEPVPFDPEFMLRAGVPDSENAVEIYA